MFIQPSVCYNFMLSIESSSISASSIFSVEPFTVRITIHFMSLC